MPIYSYQHPETEEVIEIVQSCKDEHEYTDEFGVRWNRVWHVPYASVDSTNDGSVEGFMKHTANKKGTLGDLWDASREASEKRVSKEGVDNVNEKFKKDYYKKRKGVTFREKSDRKLI